LSALRAACSSTFAASSYSALAMRARPHSRADSAAPKNAPMHASGAGWASVGVGLPPHGATTVAGGNGGNSVGPSGSARSPTPTAGFSSGAPANGPSRVRSGGGGTGGSTVAPRAGEAPVAHAGLDILHAADGLERLRGDAVAAELELGFPRQPERLGAHAVLAAARRGVGLRRRFLPVFALERRIRQVERGACRERVVGKLLPEATPRRLLVARAPEPARERGRVVERLGRRRCLLHQRLVGVLHLAAVAGARER